MESISIGISSSLIFQNHPKTLNFPSKTNLFPHSSNTSLHTLIPSPKKIIPIQTNSLTHSTLTKYNNQTRKIQSFSNHVKSHLSSLLVALTFPLSSFAADTVVQAEELPNRINLEAILLSIDEFFNKYPFFVAGVTFIWLIVVPVAGEYLQKYKYVSAIDAFRKLRDDPNAQLLDIREGKSLRYLGSPNLKILGKNVVQVEFCEGEEEGFVKKVLENFGEPSDTTMCILDNFDGNSMKVAELLFENGFKEAYAIRGGIIGKNGWQAIQETLLPPSVHVYPKKKVKKMSQQPETKGAVNKKSNNNQVPPSSTPSPGKIKKVENGYVNKISDATIHSKAVSRSLSPYPNYPDLKPPSSPTPSKP